MRLTAKEKELLHRSAQFVLAGEWPWDEGEGAKNERTREREAKALERACEKLSASLNQDRENG